MTEVRHSHTRARALGVLITGALLCLAIGPVSGQSEEGSAEITFMVDNEGAQPNAFWEGLIDRFNESHPEISVSLINPPSPGERDAYAKTLLASNTFPDVAYLLNVTQFADQLHAFDVADPDLAQLRNIDSQTIGGKLLSIGPGATPWNGLFYNKDMFAAAGIAAPPTTFEEFETALAALKAEGFTPLGTSGEWVPSFTFMATNDVLAETPCWYAKRWAGDAHFTDQEWVDAAERFASWVANGYFQDGALGNGYDQVTEAFRTGQVAMYPMGAWLTGDYAAKPVEGFEPGWFPMPSRSGEVKLVGAVGSDAFTVSATSKYPDAAVELVKFLAFDPEAVAAILETGGSFPNVEPASGPVTLDLTPLGQEVATVVGQAVSFNTAWNGQGDCAPVAGTDSDAINGFAQSLLLGEPDVQAGLASIDEFWDTNAAP